MKKLLTTLMTTAALLLIAPGAMAESALADAFQNSLGVGANVTTSDSGYFESQVRNGVMLGSGRIRFGTSMAAQPLGINIVPPSLNIGCNGIDWHFGGLSWVNGENMERMLKAAGPAALMYIVNLAINALCEDCAKELNAVIKALQKAANSSMNSCQLGQGLVDAGLGMASDQFCKNGSAQLGEADNFSAARTLCDGGSLFHLSDLGFINTIQEKADALANLTNDPFNAIFNGSVNPLDALGGADKDANEKKMDIGNHAWMALQRAGIVMDFPDIASLNGSVSESKAHAIFNQSMAIGELFMSSMDFKIKAGDEGTGDVITEHYHGTLDAQYMLGILECGTNYFNGNSTDAYGQPLPPEAKRIVREQCDALFKGNNESPGNIASTNTQILTCDGSLGNVDPRSEMAQYKMCMSESSPLLGSVPLGVWAKRGYVQDTLANGTIGMAVSALYSISKKIQGEPSTCMGSVDISHDPEAESTALCGSEIALLENAPFPLYKVVNLAALFPALRDRMFDIYGRILGLMMAQQYLLNYIHDSGQFATVQPVAGKQQQKLNHQLNQQLTRIKDQLTQELDQVAEQLQRASLLTQNIQRLEQTLRNDIFDRQILGNQAFSQSVSTAAYTNTSP